MAYGVSDEKSRAEVGRTMLMKTILETGKDGVQRLSLFDLTPKDSLYLNAWLFAFGINDTERSEGRRKLFEEGELLFSNIKHHITIHCKTRDVVMNKS